MNATTTAHATTDYTAPNTDKGAILRNDSGRLDVTFGRWESGRFVVRYFDSSRSYKTVKGAERAIAKWLAA